MQVVKGELQEVYSLFALFVECCKKVDIDVPSSSTEEPCQLMQSVKSDLVSRVFNNLFHSP